MKYKFSFFLLFYLSSAVAFGQVKYSIEAIPDSLKENANVVYFLDEGKYEIKSDNRAVYSIHSVAAILNAKGKFYATKTIGYDKLSKINSFKGVVYDQNGNEHEKLKKSEIIDQSATSGNTIFDDNRYQHADLKQSDYPYIVEFEIEIEYKFTYHIPSWSVLPGQNVSVINSLFSISSPLEFLPRIKYHNIDKEFDRAEKDGIVYLNIQFNNLKSKERESNGPPFSEMCPIIYCSPSKFHYDGYDGDLSTWSSFGKWIAGLNSGRSDLPPETVQEIKSITGSFESVEDKVHAVYQYMQDKTRYVSIQLGIGGYQPFPASVVDDLGYGDCKALSNYAYSLLKAVNIPSNYTLVYAGDNPPELDPDFSASRFNHAILCVPNKQDTLWLECTSQTNPFGYMGSFTGDRDVLLIAEDGGKIVHTPVYNKQINTQHTVAQVNVSKDGSAQANVEIVYSGLQYENKNVNQYLNNGSEEQRKWIYKNTEIPDFTIQDFSFDEIKNKIPSVVQNMKVDIPRMAKPNGKRVFLGLNLLNKDTYVPKKYEERKTDLVLDFQGIDVDTVVYQIPAHLHSEYLPEPVEIISEFGKYNSAVSFEDGKLIYVRRREYNKGRFPKELYEDYRNFCQKVIKADKSKAVFVDKT
ncbi:DUF3857 domain-containing transglutaminase family protein [Reichenbachiella sp. MALMAid0571]|uniref:DUF3857 domain-containing transglutaminase family protein n=1 Tax=Reichenbachiella sp. MALMAid0571 TaxID=3143939 RepID=UPI0032E02C9D